ncbi:OPT oligopeptide transporter [Mycena chlorophos]|uniref:OPT oligopeptide transporter n=1 Tax=Mycena chlorophos TaxID=658473 RepID=A0A8H6T0B4_MYCCL|nr:OPT oligopeptide transporter [Mycena chlorophos]
MSRPHTETPTNGSSIAGVESLLEQLQQSEEPSSGSQGRRRMSKDSEGYPSWLPKRPLHPAPASTIHGSVNESPGPFVGGRKPTPRSVRIVSMQDASTDRREPTDQTKVNIPPPRVWSRGMGTPLLVANPDPPPPQPRFHATGLHLELLRTPGFKSRLYFYLWPILVFAHIPLQTFFDLNAVFMLIQVSKFPNPQAVGVPGSGRNWALGAAAYIACWLVWIFPVVLVYEIVYSFARRWRIKRPVMLPLYLSSSGFNLVCMTSFTNFCYMQHLRYSAFFGEHGSWRDGMAETFSFYSQNLPTVALLLPRAGLSLALLLSYSSPDVGIVALADAGTSLRDKTFFRADNGTLTDYARGVLLANAAWTAWKTLLVLCSWIGLWFVSGTGCAGICGPRSRWEEEDNEKRMSVYSDNVSDLESLPWKWREATALRVQDAFEFCLATKQRWSRREKEKAPAVPETSEIINEPATPYEGMDRVMAVAGFPSAPPPARRGVLSGDLFETPVTSPEFGNIIPKVVHRSSKEHEREGQGPLMKLPYPFSGPSAQVSSQDRVPFPPSPRASQSQSRENSGGGSGDQNEDEDDEDEEEDDDDDDDDDERMKMTMTRRSLSMAAKDRRLAARLALCRVLVTLGSSHASPTNTSRHTNSQSQSTGPHNRSILSQSTGNRESSDSHQPRSQHTASASSSSAPEQLPHSASGSSASLGIPMPPRHPQPRGRGRSRAGTVPVPASTSSSSISMPPPTPVDFPRRPRTRTTSAAATAPAPDTLQPQPGLGGPNESFDGASEGEHEDEGEREDQLGLLTGSQSPSPRTSFSALRQRASNMSLSLSVQQRRTSRYSSSHSGSGSGSGPHSRTHSHSGSSSARSRAESMNAVRSRAQSLLQNIGINTGLGVTSIEGRVRANSSMARLEEDSASEQGRSRSGSNANTHSRSGSDALSSGENNTFGHPLRTQWHDAPSHTMPPSPVPEASSERSYDVSERSHNAEDEQPGHSQLQPVASRSTVFSAPSFMTEQPTATEGTISRPASAGQLAPEPVGIPIPIIRTGPVDEPVSSSSYPDVSSAPHSFVTAPATVEGATTTGSSDRTVSSFDGTAHLLVGGGRTAGGSRGRGQAEEAWHHPGPA